jgi:iron complex outermembrane receptor protein
VVLSQPSWARGFNLSIDYFDIKVKNVISSLNPQQEVDLCYGGNQQVCSVRVDQRPGRHQLRAGAELQLRVAAHARRRLRDRLPQNLGDFGLPGSFTLRGLATRTIHSISDPGVPGTTPSEGAGNMTGATPKWKALVSQSWDGPAGRQARPDLTERWIGAGVFNNEYIECQTNCPLPTAAHPTIYDNHMPGAVYIDFGGTYNFSKQITAYFKIDNLADRARCWFRRPT